MSSADYLAGSTTLLIGAGETSLATSAGVFTLACGSVDTPRACFRRDPPDAADVERAIDVVEDEVMRIVASFPAGGPLVTADAAIRQVALLSGVADAPRMVMDLQALELSFNRLADAANGLPASRAGIPAGPAFAATLVILREVMHHLRFDRIAVEAPQPRG